jgi:hypothetical protein
VRRRRLCLIRKRLIAFMHAAARRRPRTIEEIFHLINCYTITGESESNQFLPDKPPRFPKTAGVRRPIPGKTPPQSE